MIKFTKILIEHGTQLSQQEIESINVARAREWKTPPMQKTEQESTLFFLLKDDENLVLSQGGLMEIDGIIFNNESFSIFGIGGIIANEKGKGYGRQCMIAMRDYITKHKKQVWGLQINLVFMKSVDYLLTENL